MIKFKKKTVKPVQSFQLNDFSYTFNDLIERTHIRLKGHSLDTHFTIGTQKMNSFFTEQTADYLESFVNTVVDAENEDNPKLFSISYKTVQNEFKQASDFLGISLNPHALRTVFAEQCRQAGIEKEYIDAFEGRTSQGILEKHYTDYSPEAMRKQYDLLESFLTLDRLV